MQTLEVRRLVAFGRQVHGDAERDLTQLQIIDGQLDRIDGAYERVCQVHLAADHYIDKIREFGLQLPPDGIDLVRVFEEARDKLGACYEDLTNLQLAVVNSPVYHDDDCIVEAFASLVDEVAELHNKFNTLAWLIGEGIADQEKPLPGKYTNAEDVIAALRAR